MKKWILLSAIILVSSCATTPVPVTLNCPPPLELPLLDEYQATELQRISDETYTILVVREKLMKQRIVTLCAIIESTH